MILPITINLFPYLVSIMGVLSPSFFLPSSSCFFPYPPIIQRWPPFLLARRHSNFPHKGCSHFSSFSHIPKSVSLLLLYMLLGSSSSPFPLQQLEAYFISVSLTTPSKCIISSPFHTRKSNPPFLPFSLKARYFHPK